MVGGCRRHLATAPPTRVVGRAGIMGPLREFGETGGSDGDPHRGDRGVRLGVPDRAGADGLGSGRAAGRSRFQRRRAGAGRRRLRRPGLAAPGTRVGPGRDRAAVGVGFITWHAGREAVDLALSYRPAAAFLSFGDPLKYAELVKAAGCTLICQVQEVEEARAAIAAGADMIVAQGSEAGGHGALRATLPLVPAVVDAVAPIPVLAAGGIADGRGLAAALMLGAHGAMIGTRFSATSESLTHERARERIVAARAADTVATRVFDIVRG